MVKHKRFLSKLLVFLLIFNMIQVPAFSKPVSVYAGAIQTVSGGYGFRYGEDIKEQAIDVGTYFAQYGNKIGINDAQYYYYNKLNDLEKVMYLLMEQCDFDNSVFYIKGYESMLNGESIFNMAENAICALQYDQPMTRLMWALWRIDIRTGNDVAKVTMIRDPLATEYNIQKTNAIIDNIVAAVPTGTDRYTTLMNLSLYIAGTRAYNPYSEGAGVSDMSTDYIDSIDQSPIGVFTYKYAVCNAYSYACKILCDRFDIPCVSVMNIGHAWNYIQMEDGKWYSLDWTYANNWFNDMRTFNTFAKNYLISHSLLGSSDKYYVEDDRYHLNFRLGGGMSVTVPELSTTGYSYSGSYNYSFGSVEGFEEPEGRFLYEVNDDGTTCKITGYEGLQQGDLIIPETIDGLTVTSIGDSAFYRATGFTGNLVIPDSIVTIEDGAFLECSNLTGLSLSNNLKSIGRVAFAGCDNFKGKLFWPSSIESMPFNDDMTLQCRLDLNNFEEIECYCDNELAINVCEQVYNNSMVFCHTWNEGVIITAPTVSSTGIKQFTCTHCGATYDATLEKLTESAKNGLQRGEDGNWYYYENDIVVENKTGLITNASGSWYVENGKINFNKTGVITSEGKEYYVHYGYMSTGFYGLVRKDDGTWAYAEAGELTYNYTGLAKNDAGWWFITDGVIDFSYTGIGSNQTGDYRVVNGLIDFSYDGWFNANGNWWYMKGGMVDKTKAGLVKKENDYYYVKNGEIDFKYTGLVENAGNTYYVKYGYLDFGFSGEVQSGNTVLTVKNGIVQ